jgi:hypothetical protein
MLKQKLKLKTSWTRTLLIVLFFSTFQLHQVKAKDSTFVKSIEGITNKMLEILSGPIDEKRDWDTYRYLFLPAAQKISINPNVPPRSQVKAMNIEEFIRYTGPLFKRDGFLEFSIGLTVNEYNGLANVFQAYTAKNLLGTYEKRGINSYQLVYLNDRWWIAGTTFITEDPDNPIPDELLFKEYQQEQKSKE